MIHFFFRPCVNVSTHLTFEFLQQRLTWLIYFDNLETIPVVDDVPLVSMEVLEYFRNRPFFLVADAIRLKIFYLFMEMLTSIRETFP